jgi:hypothetical protein
MKTGSNFVFLFAALIYQGFTLKTIWLKRSIPLFLLLLICVTLVSCQFISDVQSIVSPRSEPPSTSTKDSSPTPTLTETLAFTATVTLTSTPENTATPENTPTPEPTTTPIPSPTPKPIPYFDQFVASVVNGSAWQVVGVYVENVLSLRVVQQPASNQAYVSTQNNVATYFKLVWDVTGNNGLLAHNYLAGGYFFNLRSGQIVVLIYGDGRTEEYGVNGAEQFQALSPTSPTSDFVNLSSGERLSSTDLFYRVYGGGTRTTFQTCIAQGNESSWGRLFVIAPIE